VNASAWQNTLRVGIALSFFITLIIASLDSLSTVLLVMAGLVPAISRGEATPCLYKRDYRNKPGDDDVKGVANSAVQSMD